MRNTPIIIALAGLTTGTTAAPTFFHTDANAGAPPAPALTDPTRFNTTITVDLSGINSWDAAGSTLNETLSIAIGGDFLVTGIAWDVTIATVGASWLSEVQMGFLDSDIGLQLSFGAGDNTPGTATYTSGGILDLGSIDPTFPFFVGADGILDLEFREGFDDVTGAIDATFLAGSSVTIQYVYPAPGSLALLGFGGLVAGRRRRSTRLA